MTATIVPVGATRSGAYPAQLPDVTWTVHCVAAANLDCSAGLQNVHTTFAATNDTVDEDLIGMVYAGQLDASGTYPLPIADSCFGCKVKADVGGSCGNGLATAATGTTTPVAIIPPVLFLFSGSTIVLNPGDSATYVNVDAIPVNTPFRLSGVFLTRPRGSESATLRLVGAGIDLSRTYVDDPATDRLDEDVFTAYKADPASIATATSTGTVRAWLEFEGVKSNEVLLTVVAQGSGSGGGGGSSSTGGGSNATGGGAGSGTKGCATAPGGLLFGALAIVLARRRR